ncbi:hypothetical protein M011DRAFT_469439 [Sporormia fimetaria CBS 119925]|uniref:Uncharacterized protein n=1 Tax=Sporormia fimetaria CBS 119925 TaxID=1340428 RepID=A0A6A6V668_9PLEO|nr:hypothetical protein M011DRAFT_469439 [Sporormia fimetaria CBS 119925]
MGTAALFPATAATPPVHHGPCTSAAIHIQPHHTAGHRRPHPAELLPPIRSHALCSVPPPAFYRPKRSQMHASVGEQHLITLPGNIARLPPQLYWLLRQMPVIHPANRFRSGASATHPFTTCMPALLRCLTNKTYRPL